MSQVLFHFPLTGVIWVNEMTDIECFLTHLEKKFTLQ